MRRFHKWPKLDESVPAKNWPGIKYPPIFDYPYWAESKYIKFDRRKKDFSGMTKAEFELAKAKHYQRKQARLEMEGLAWNKYEWMRREREYFLKHDYDREFLTDCRSTRYIIFARADGSNVGGFGLRIFGEKNERNYKMAAIINRYLTKGTPDEDYKSSPKEYPGVI